MKLPVRFKGSVEPRSTAPCARRVRAARTQAAARSRQRRLGLPHGSAQTQLAQRQPQAVAAAYQPEWVAAGWQLAPTIQDSQRPAASHQCQHCTGPPTTTEQSHPAYGGEPGPPGGEDYRFGFLFLAGRCQAPLFAGMNLSNQCAIT